MKVPEKVPWKVSVNRYIQWKLWTLIQALGGKSLCRRRDSASLTCIRMNRMHQSSPYTTYIKCICMTYFILQTAICVTYLYLHSGICMTYFILHSGIYVLHRQFCRFSYSVLQISIFNSVDLHIPFCRFVYFIL